MTTPPDAQEASETLAAALATYPEKRPEFARRIAAHTAAAVALAVKPLEARVKELEAQVALEVGNADQNGMELRRALLDIEALKGRTGTFGSVLDRAEKAESALATAKADVVRLRGDLSQIRDTAIAMDDSLRSIPPKNCSVLLVEGPRRIKEKANAALSATSATYADLAQEGKKS
jgi:hypothetical protein